MIRIMKDELEEMGICSPFYIHPFVVVKRSFLPFCLYCKMSLFFTAWEANITSTVILEYLDINSQRYQVRSHKLCRRVTQKLEERRKLKKDLT